MLPTPDQHNAITTHDRNLAVVAGAGSGKTRVLVERYLELLRVHPDWRLDSLVAITFTSKAAQEMRDRVRQELEKSVANAPPDDKPRWEGLLAAMDSARIDTIHALCASILRANAAEAGLDPRFDVLDEIDAQILLDQAIEQTLQTFVSTNHPALSLFAEYGAQQVRETAAELVAVDLPPFSPDAFDQWQEEWRQNAAARIEALVSLPEMRDGWTLTPPPDDKLTDVYLNARLEVQTLLESRDLDACLTALRRLSSEIRINMGSAGAWGGRSALDAVKETLKAVRETSKICMTAIGDPPGDRDRRAVALIPLWEDLVRAVKARYQTLKAENALLDFNDLELRARDLLVYHRTVRDRYRGAEFKHLLVDEFQDTNAAQWEIVQALADPSQPGALFIVGDAKQSIYAFRGADVTVFEAAQQAIIDAGGARIALVDSFRTHKPLVDSFNHLFSRLMTRSSGSPYEVEFGKPMAAQRPAPNTLPTLELLLIEGKTNDGADEIRRYEAAEIAQRLHALVSSGTLIHDRRTGHPRPVGYGDVALLFQSTSMIILYEDVFKAYGLPFVTVAGRGYYDRQEVWDVLHLLTVLHNPADNLALSAVLRSPMFGVSDEGLFVLRQIRDADAKEPIPLWQALDRVEPSTLPEADAVPVLFARDCLYGLQAAAGRITIAELLREAFVQTGYLAVLTGLPDGARRRGNVEKLLVKAQESGQTTLGAFSQYLRDLSAREAREGEAPLEGIGAVTLMTVHASKGLEFPVVVLPDCSWIKGNEGGSPVVYHATLGLGLKVYDEIEKKLKSCYLYQRISALEQQKFIAERKRLLYVAMTRAQDLLLLSGAGRARTDSWLSWVLSTLELKEARDGDHDFGWGTVRLTRPAPPDELHQSVEEHTLWDSPQDDLPVQEPPLLRPVRGAHDAPLRFLSATQIASMSDEDPAAQARLRRSLLHDAPGVIEQVSERNPRVSGRQLGDIVHQVLRWNRLPLPPDQLRRLLSSYAWEEGILQEELIENAVYTAGNWLGQIARSPIYQRILNAEQVYRELPFVYHNQRRTIYGVIDVLLRDAHGWAIVDYKTSFVPGIHKAVEGSSVRRGLLERHARRYYLQMGVYAAAVREQLGGIEPSVHIYYIRYQETVEVPAAAYQAALAELEDRIGSFMGDDL